jgi:ectoine hydroxylase-related dioxygenase (phytanoyl-CoA dioxygenase family)
MQQLTHTTADDVESIIAAIDRDGGVIVDDYVSCETAAALHHDYAAAIADEPWCNASTREDDVFFGLKSKRLHGLLAHSAHAERCLMHPLASALAKHYLGKRIILSTGELMAIGPREVRQALHRDAASWERAEQSGELLFSANIALTDFTRANGATVVVPGSHDWDAEREPQDAQLAYAEMRAGSALLYNGRIIHGGGANETDHTRIGLYFGYIPNWLRPIENCAITHPRELLESLNPQTQRMLGYSEAGFEVVL